MTKFKVQYPISEYTFPREATIRDVHFDDEHMHVELTDGRIMSAPLALDPDGLSRQPGGARQVRAQSQPDDDHLGPGNIMILLCHLPGLICRQLT